MKLKARLHNAVLDIGEHVEKQRYYHRKIGYGLIGEYLMKSFSEEDLGKLFAALAFAAVIWPDRGRKCNNFKQFIDGQCIY